MTWRLIDAMLFIIAVLLVWGAVLTAPASHASTTACDARYDACAAPRWCASTGTLIGPFSGYCPVGPHNYSPPWGDDDDE